MIHRITQAFPNEMLSEYYPDARLYIQIYISWLQDDVTSRLSHPLNLD